MDKIARQREIVKCIATEPWVYSLPSLALKLGVNLVTVQRDLREMKDNGFQFKQNDTEKLYLEASGWNGALPVKTANLRQMEILRMLTSTPAGLTLGELYKRLNRQDKEEISSKTLERALKGLVEKHIIEYKEQKYSICSEQMLPPLQLNNLEKTVLLEALNLAHAFAPIPEEMKTLEAKLKLWIGQNSQSRAALFVQGRTPTQDVHQSQCCLLLEEAARDKKQVEILYRKDEGAARQIRLNPLGIVYYWVLDNWYLIAQDEQDQKIKTYLVNRIIDITKSDKLFPPIEGFDLKTWYQNAWGVYRDEKPVLVKIRFRDYYSTINRVKTELASRKTCTLMEDRDGLLMLDRVEGLEELAVWLRGFGAGAEVLEPLVLREKVFEEYRQLLRMYGGDSYGLD
ncbi:putative transcriptional regulator [Desulfosporosinus orientis DSM 765]|uniref:Putative transcriptional regulator n=1 Tax=Desulfosporosinus orientis (strain ATCC 19365 / DSM 765 / NCIMB 8382 / VKM B-1628 / Singapore I) TaxID=768706 RepID=G7W7Y0_DESOD|nr:WYL domain-containing protein [Desulfosporosinus orientis]AET66406.1 putative transcriptional regulator [Desulfosporosinus orientis DSM 765]